MNIAVVDSGTNLVAFNKMDGAWLGSIDIAQKKAKTARFFNMNSGEIGNLSQPGGSLYNRALQWRVDYVSRRGTLKKCRRRNYRRSWR